MCGSTELERPPETGSATPPGSLPGNGPASFVAAEIHLGHQVGWLGETIDRTATFKLRASSSR
jgi:hypothetical protein